MSKHPFSETRAASLAGVAGGGLVCGGWLGDSELDVLDGAGLSAVLGDIGRLRNRLDGYQAKVLGRMERLRKRGGAVEVKPHLAIKNATGVSDREARHAARLAEQVNENEEVLGALCAGVINSSQADAISGAEVPEQVREELLAGATSQNADETRKKARQAEREHSAETSDERYLRQRRNRYASWRFDEDDDMFKLRASFDPVVGSQVAAMLDPLRKQFWLEDKHVRNNRRSPGQRDADVLAYALAGAIGSQADRGAIDRHLTKAAKKARRSQTETAPPDDGLFNTETCGSEGPPSPNRKPARGHQPAKDGDAGAGFAFGWSEPVGRSELGGGVGLLPAQVSVLIDLEALRGQTDAAGVTDTGIELSPEQVRRLACDAEIIPVNLDGKGGPADIGRSRRTPPQRLKREIIARDRTCRSPGCDTPASRCDVHHITHWAQGGPTNADNLILLCHQHHHDLHAHNLRMTPQPDGTWTAQPDPPTKPGRPDTSGTPDREKGALFATEQHAQQPRGP